jgi:hypothetical protein
MLLITLVAALLTPNIAVEDSAARQGRHTGVGLLDGVLSPFKWGLDGRLWVNSSAY